MGLAQSTVITLKLTNMKYKLTEDKTFTICTPDGTVWSARIHSMYLAITSNSTQKNGPEDFFKTLGITDPIAFFVEVYGYPVYSGRWPEFEPYDYAALDRVLIKLQREYDIEINGLELCEQSNEIPFTEVIDPKNRNKSESVLLITRCAFQIEKLSKEYIELEQRLSDIKKQKNMALKTAHDAVHELQKQLPLAVMHDDFIIVVSDTNLTIERNVIS